MALFKIDLKLEPSPDGQRQLEGWPDTTFHPDFTVAASGSLYLEFTGKVAGVNVDGELTGLPLEKAEAETFNPWLPDYIAGFAFNLATAAVKIKGGVQEKASAKFLDEPVELRLQEFGEATIKVSLRYQAKTIAGYEGPKALILAEIGRALQDFMVQLLSLNPRLAEYEEVAQLRGLIAQIVS